MTEQIEAIMHRGRAVRDLILVEAEQASPTQLTMKPGNRWSAREVLIHIGNWEEEAVRWLSHLVKGEQPPRRDAKHIDELNAEMLANYADLDARGALAYIQRVRQELEDVAAVISEDQWRSNPSFKGILLMTTDHEIGHLHQLREVLASARGEVVEAVIHGLRYTRQRVLTRLNLESRSVDSLTWRSPAGAWTVKETLIHLAVWDRVAATAFAAIADGLPLPVDPFEQGGLDRWNKEQVNARSWMTLADILHELGAAREALELQVRRLTPQLLATADAQHWLGYREHDNHHMYKILETLQAWQAHNS